MNDLETMNYLEGVLADAKEAKLKRKMSKGINLPKVVKVVNIWEAYPHAQTKSAADAPASARSDAPGDLNLLVVRATPHFKEPPDREFLNVCLLFRLTVFIFS